MAHESFHDRVYRWLLRLFPSEFRGDFGDDMRADFDDQRRDVHGRRRATAALWLRTLIDLVRRAPREHVDVLWRDMRHGVRVLRRHPASTITAILSLAVGIGMNSAVFSVVNGVLWRDLPLPDSDRLVIVNAFRPSSPSPFFISSSTFLEMQRRATTMDRIAAGRFHPLTIVDPIEPEQVTCSAVSEGYFGVLGSLPTLGRSFTRPDYDASIAHWARQDPKKPRFGPVPHVMILSHAMWQRHFLGGPNVVGQQVVLDGGDRVEIIGVMGPELDALAGAIPGQCWVPEAADPDDSSGIMIPIARLRPGRSVEDANAELAVISKQLPPAPYVKEPISLRAERVLDQITSRVRAQLMFLFGAVVCVLLVTCANVVSLFLAHVAGRRDELATRVALGASRARLVRQTLSEVVSIALLGGACGFVLAVVGVPLLVATAPPDVPRLQQIGVDWPTFVFTSAVSVGVGIICGLLASMPTRGVPRRLFGAVRAGAEPNAARFRRSLTVGEIALALMLVVAATLMVRTVRALGAIDLGFDPAHVVVADLSAPGRTPGGRADGGRQFQMDVIERVKALPGVRAAGIGLGPLSGGMFMGDVIVPGDTRRFDLRVDAVSPGYFEALGARLLAGRFFEPRDTAPGLPQMILVNDTAARTLWPGRSAVGESIIVNERDELRVIGVVNDTRGGTLEEDPGPMMYQLSVQSRNFGVSTMLIRADDDPAALVPQIRAIIRSVSRNAPFRGVSPLQERIDRSLAPRLFVLRVIGLFSILGLILAVVGVYGVVAEFVAQRVPEIGVRMAFGATSSDVLRLILGQGGRLVIAGVVLGIAGAALFRGAMKTMVFSVDTLDPVTYTTACVSLMLATIAACAIPARRASRLDPAVALRE
jgi:putative ABC transport system permease protein